MIQIIQNENGFHVVNVTLGCVIDSFKTEKEAEALKNKIVNN